MRLAMSFRTRRELLIQIPFLKELIPALVRHGHLKLEGNSREKITTISAATIDRILPPHRLQRLASLAVSRFNALRTQEWEGAK